MSKQHKEDTSTGKELVRRNHVPLWDAMVENIINDMVKTIKDPDLDLDVQGRVLRSKAQKLARLVDELDSGTSKYGVLSPVTPSEQVEPEPEPVDEADTPTSILQLTDDEVWERLRSMSTAEKEAFINEVTATRGTQ